MSNIPSGDDNSRRELYERFLADLAKDRRMMFYDLDDLIELYDYANDSQDKYVAMEVLFCGERLYPESVELAERRALFYFGYDEQAAVSAVKTLPDTSLIKQLLTIRLNHTAPEEAAVLLEAALAERSEFTDEEIIQFAETAEALGMYEWLLEHKQAVCSHTDYPQTFIYELTQIAMERDPETAIKLLEELTMMEPFAVDFWLTMSQIYVGYLGKPDKALSALEYALAIEPDNVRGLMLKAQCFNDLNYPIEQIEPVLRDVMRRSPDVTSAPLALALLYSNEGRRAESLAIISDMLESFVADPQMLDVYLTVAADDARTEVIQRFLPPEYEAYSDDFIAMAERHASEGRHEAAGALLLALDCKYGIEDDRDLLMEELYRAGKYAEAAAHLESMDSTPVFERELTSSLTRRMEAFIYILCLLRLGRKDDGMLEFTARLLSFSLLDVERDSGDNLLRGRSLIKLLIKLHAYLSGIDSLSIDEIDPFVKGLS